HFRRRQQCVPAKQSHILLPRLSSSFYYGKCSNTELNKTLGVLASGASIKKYGLAQVEGNLGDVPRFPGIGAKPYNSAGRENLPP
ncbi:hypothetical protein, partial [Deinococcus sp. UYEF24]